MSDKKFPIDIEERYLLNRLSPEEREAYEKHLEDNESARDALENERILIAGIRRAGRHNLKREIREQVRDRNSIPQDWSILWKAAAVFLLAVLVPSLVFFSYQFQQDEAATLSNAHKMEAPVADRLEPSATEEIIEAEKRESTMLRRDVPAESDKMIAGKERIPLGQTLEAGSQAGAGSGFADNQLDDLKKSKNQEIAAAEPPIAVSEELVAVEDSDQNEDSRLPYQAVKLRNLHKGDREAMIVDSITGRDDALAFNAPGDLQNGQRYNYVGEDNLARRSRSATKPQWKLQGNARQTFEAKDKEGKSASKNWVYQSGTAVIRVLLNASVEQDRDGSSSYPGGFPVTIVNNDDQYLELSWTVPPSIISLNPEQLTLQRFPGDILRITVDDSLHYRIDLNTSATEANRIPKE